MQIRICPIRFGIIASSVPDPDPPDPHIFGRSGSGSNSERYFDVNVRVLNVNDVNMIFRIRLQSRQSHGSADSEPNLHQYVMDPEH
jgi:hypothetical protein